MYIILPVNTAVFEPAQGLPVWPGYGWLQFPWWSCEGYRRPWAALPCFSPAATYPKLKQAFTKKLSYLFDREIDSWSLNKYLRNNLCLDTHLPKEDWS